MAGPGKDLWEMVQSVRGVLPPVEYGFHSAAWRGAPWHVAAVELHEALSEPYRLILELVVDDLDSAIDPLLGATCELTIGRGAAGRPVCGLVLELDDLGVIGGRRLVRASVGPALALLAQQVNTRAWQDRSAIEVLEAVLGEGLAPYRRSLRLALERGDYPRRDYCTQFRESDLEFAARLLAEEGISYYFEHEDGAEVMVLVDDNAHFPALSTRADGDSVPVVENAADTAPRESVQAFTWSRRLHATSAVSRDVDFLRPDAPSSHEARGQDDAGREREVYFHGERALPDDGARRVRLRRERLAVAGKVARGSSNATVLQAGLRFRLADHRRGELDRSYVLTRVVHRGSCPDVRIERARAEAGPRYTNEFECVPDDVPVRPTGAHRKPRVYGPTTATVVGPESEEVHTDEHGRVKLLFPWDRLSPADDTASWWVRVAQGWAGPGWGSLFVPRIGMEVVVEFLDGDPDRPLVTGCVYNGRNPPPYALPADKTKSTIKTNTSPSDGGFNELRFEDQKGVEEVFLHAERDLNAVVKHDMTLTVGGDERDTVTRSRTTAVHMEEALTVGMNRAETVGMNRAVTIGMNSALTVGMNHSEQVAMAAARSVGATYQVAVGAAMTEQIGHSKTETIGDFKAVTTGRGSNEEVGEDKTVEVAEDSSETIGRDKHVDAGENLMQSAGKSLSLSAGERMTLSAGDNLTLVGEKKGLLVIEDQLVIRVGEAAIVMKKNGDILISGAKISVLGTGDVKVRGAKTTAN